MEEIERLVTNATLDSAKATIPRRHYKIRPDGTLAFTDAKINKDGILVLSFHEVTKIRRK